MKTEFLKGLGLSQDIIDKIMAENGKDIEAEKSKVTAKETELSTANQTIKDLQDTIKKYDGKDPVKLQNDLQALQTKYDADVAAERKKAESLQKEYALKEGLKASGVIDPDYLIYKHGGVEKFAFTTDGKPAGIEEVTKSYRESSPHIFEAQQTKPFVKTGMRQTGTEGTPDRKEEANAAFRSLFGKEN